MIKIEPLSDDEDGDASEEIRKQVGAAQLWTSLGATFDLPHGASMPRLGIDVVSAASLLRVPVEHRIHVRVFVRPDDGGTSKSCRFSMFFDKRRTLEHLGTCVRECAAYEHPVNADDINGARLLFEATGDCPDCEYVNATSDETYPFEPVEPGSDEETHALHHKYPKVHSYNEWMVAAREGDMPILPLPPSVMLYPQHPSTTEALRKRAHRPTDECCRSTVASPVSDGHRSTTTRSRIRGRTRCPLQTVDWHLRREDDGVLSNASVVHGGDDKPIS